MQCIVLRHLSGSKAQQVESFPLDYFRELIIGRDPSATVKYDPDRDELVSRQHAKITHDINLTQFLITDLNSSNGTYLNHQRVIGTARIAPGDVIQLGLGGPEFQFDLEPRQLNAPTLNSTPLPATFVGGLTPASSQPYATPSGGAHISGYPSAGANSMMEEVGYKVFPTDPTPVSISRANVSGVGGTGCWTGGCLWLIACPVLFALLRSIGLFDRNEASTAFQILLVLAVSAPIFGLILFLIDIFLRDSKARQSEWAATQSNAQKRAAEAAQLTQRLNNILKESSDLASRLQKAFNGASHSINLARHEYEDNAPGPFWDAVEDSAGCLAEYDSLIQKLSKKTNEYYSLLQGRKHTFPLFPIQAQNLPDSTAIIRDLNQIVRLGQKADPKPHFYDVWERRREHQLTRQVMISGFRTLGEAINNIGPTIEESVFDLQRAFSSDMAKLVEEEIKTRSIIDEYSHEQNQMLDNIQRHRKPFP